MKTALISGSTSGIGLGIAREFVKSGYHILFNGLEKEGPQIADYFSKEYGIKCIHHNANMLEPLEIINMVKEAEKHFGGVDVLICNAGIQYVSAIDEFPEDKWSAILGINLTSVFHLSKAVWGKMKKNKWGRIINIASAHALVGSEFKSAYVASKHGLAGLTKVLALEGAPFGITANAICPGYVKTALVEKQIYDQAKTHGISEEEVISKVMLNKHAVKEFVNIESIGKLALYLASEDACMITGTTIPIDGGWSAQ
jgi:3-hydroxybutyrate dehydrogenase